MPTRGELRPSFMFLLAASLLCRVFPPFCNVQCERKVGPDMQGVAPDAAHALWGHSECSIRAAREQERTDRWGRDVKLATGTPSILSAHRQVPKYGSDIAFSGYGGPGRGSDSRPGH